MFHNLGTLLSLQPVMNGPPLLSNMATLVFVNRTLKPASQDSPIPIMLWLNPSITCPEVGRSFGRPGRSSLHEADEVCGWPDDVPT